MSAASRFLEWVIAGLIASTPWILLGSPVLVLAFFVIRALWRDYWPWNGGV
jgi:hypothetical protein